MSQALEVAKRFCLSLQSAASPRHSDDARVVYQAQRKDNTDDSVFEAIRDLQHEVRRLRETQGFNMNHVGFSKSDFSKTRPSSNTWITSWNIIRVPAAGCDDALEIPQCQT